MTDFIPILTSAGTALWQALVALLVPAPFFILLALIVKGRTAFRDARRALDESRVNLLIHFLDALLLAPLLALFAAGMEAALWSAGLVLVPTGFWSGLPAPVVAFAAVFVGDFVGYWRHRLEHSPLLWPSHAIHHSDTEMTWLTLARFHPINRLTTVVIDAAVLIVLGFPPFAVIVNNFVRHYYGMYIHADLQWTHGPLGKVLVSPAMHRWHHAKDPRAYDTNFATVFSLFDVWFGTYRVPGPCDVPLGVADDMGHGVAGQMAYPLRLSRYPWLMRWLGRQSGDRAGSTSPSP